MIIAQKAVHTGNVIELPNIIRDDNRQIISIRKRRLQILRMALNRHRDRRRIQTVGTVPDSAASPAGSKRQDLPERIKNQSQMFFVQMLFQNFRVGVRDFSGKPKLQSLRSAFAKIAVFVSQ